jgi:hypothetical protein
MYQAVLKGFQVICWNYLLMNNFRGKTIHNLLCLDLVHKFYGLTFPYQLFFIFIPIFGH